MSFSANPYKEMTVVTNEDGTVSWMCDSCGGGWRDKYPVSTSIERLRRYWLNHVELSHKLTFTLCRDWGGGF